jgi:hypothetical protein
MRGADAMLACAVEARGYADNDPSGDPPTEAGQPERFPVTVGGRRVVVMSGIVRFAVSRDDMDLVLAELRNQRPTDVLYAALLAALHDAAVRLDTDASRLDTGHEQMTELLLPGEHAQPFREWLQRTVMRWSSAGDHAKAQAFARVHGSER